MKTNRIKSILLSLFILSATIQINAQAYTDECFVMKRELDGSYYTVKNNQLYFTIDGEYNTMNLDFEIFNFQRQAMPGMAATPPSLNQGDNRYLIVVTSLPPGYYVLEVTNQKKEKRVLRFYKP